MEQALKRNSKPILYILIGCTIWHIGIFLLMVLTSTLEEAKGQIATTMPYVTLFHSIIKSAITYYVLIFVMCIPFVEKRNWKKFLSQCAIFFLLLTIYECWFNFKISNPIPVDSTMSTNELFLGQVIASIVFDIVMLIISIFVATMMVSSDMRRRKIRLEKEKLRAELSAIKFQINPHFLFNSLSFIYTKTLKTSPEAAHAVHLLSEIMSYALDDWDDLGTVPMHLEIEQVKRVIEMNQIRFDNKLKVRYHEYVERDDIAIPILSFVTLIENAFKHGDLSDDQHPVMIKLEATKNKIFFMVSNKKRNEMLELSHGIGLKNIRQRLQLMYGDNYSFVIKEDNNNYSTEITINL